MKRKGFFRSDRCLTYTEWGLLGVLVCLVLVFCFTDLRHHIFETYTDLQEESLQEL